MTIKGMKTKVATMMAAGFLAGALVVAAPVKAEAQRVVVRFGGPRYVYAPAPVVYGPAYAPGYYGYGHPYWGGGHWRGGRGFYGRR
ncbi:hypothetical protein FTO74_15630 [Granulicella sp. WH15]|uniref:hypothetical protein n=1 Tax=Granulicella sp. WH15 TaxID=2602070 RepID=UPI0013677FB6|nr:hypothetical protein [Granulicella sp. WH15]QHN04631.1 hypothetical protein FTO74_15630 [Granulicella sp. WH15]